MEEGDPPTWGSVKVQRAGPSWETGEASREEEGRIPRTNRASVRGTLLLLFILFGFYCPSVQLVSRHMVGGMDHSVGNLAYLLQN